MLASEEWIACSQVWYVYEIGMKVPFSKEYRYVRNHLHWYVTNYYIFVFTLTVLMADYVR